VRTSRTAAVSPTNTSQLCASCSNPHPEFHAQHIDYGGRALLAATSPRIPILVGGDSPRVKRAATLGDGWYGLWQSPDQCALRSPRSTPSDGRHSSRCRARADARRSPVPDSDSETTLQGGRRRNRQKIQRYSDAGVDESSSNSCPASWTILCQLNASQRNTRASRARATERERTCHCLLMDFTTSPFERRTGRAKRFYTGHVRLSVSPRKDGAVLLNAHGTLFGVLAHT